MKKIIFPILMLTFIVSTTFAGPFGLSKGMSVEEISKLCEKGCEPTSSTKDDRYIFVPQKKHELFKTYVGFIDQEKGLYRIRTMSENISTNSYGTELKNAFHAMVTRLSRIYGIPKITDKIREDYHSNEDTYWFSSLQDGARELSATWKKGENGTNLPEELENVTIFADANFFYGFLIIDYCFSNFAEVQDKQDDVL